MDGDPDPQHESGEKRTFLDRVIEKFSESRFFTISFIFHVLLIFIFGGTVLFEAMQEPADFEGGEGGFLAAGEETAAPPPAQSQPKETTFTVSTPVVQNTTVAAITTTGQNPLSFSMDAVITPSTMAKPAAPSAPAAAAPSAAGMAGMTGAMANDMRDFTKGWGKGPGSGVGTRQREFKFTAFVAQYAGGTADTVYRTDGPKGIPQGALPNLLEFISKASGDKIKTDYKNVKSIPLDSDKLFSEKPPFIFLTGSRDFTLTDKEIENLRKYIRLGGAIWGDSSVPGEGSRFDIAFRREMKRVMPDKDKDFERLEATDPMFKRSPYFPEIQQQPPGLNYADSKVLVMRYFGEIAIIYTSNSYSQMWQFGIKEDARKWVINADRDEEEWQRGKPFVAQYEPLYLQTDIYVHNIDPKDIGAKGGLLDSYKFGTNMIIHLLTRWEDKLRSAPRL